MQSDHSWIKSSCPGFSIRLYNLIAGQKTNWKKITFRFVEGLKSQQVQDFVITQIRNEKEEQHLDIPVRRVLEIVKTLEAEEDIENEDELDDLDEEEEELEYEPEDKNKLNYQSGSKQSSNEKVVVIKRELSAGDDDFSRSYTQQYPTVKQDSLSAAKFSSLSSKLRSERSQLFCELCDFKCLSKVLLASHSMCAHSQVQTA